MMNLESLFRYLKESNKVGTIELSFEKIESVIGEKLSYSAKSQNFFWNQPGIKRLMANYNVKFSYLNALTGFIYFEIL